MYVNVFLGNKLIGNEGATLINIAFVAYICWLIILGSADRKVQANKWPMNNSRALMSVQVSYINYLISDFRI